MFDKVLKPNVTQEQVYNGAAKHIVKGDVVFMNLTEKFDIFFCFVYNFNFSRQIEDFSKICLIIFNESSGLTNSILQMYFVATMELFSLMVKPLPERPIPWRASLEIPISRVSFPELSMTSLTTSTVWKKTWSFTSKCLILRSIWTKSGTCWTLQR